MRLFVALEIPSAVRDRFVVLLDDLRMLDPKASGKEPRWLRPENLHVTLKFIGNVASEKSDFIRAALAEVRSEGPIAVRFRGLGFFPNDKRPRVLWARVDASQNLSSVAAEIDQRLAKLDIPGERRSFTPHLTLARLQPSGISAALQAAVEKNAGREFGEFHTNAFHLIESKLKPSGAEYTTLQSFSFAAEA